MEDIYKTVKQYSIKYELIFLMLEEIKPFSCGKKGDIGHES